MTNFPNTKRVNPIQWDPKLQGRCLSWTSHMLQAYMDDPWSYGLTYVHGRRSPAGGYAILGSLWSTFRGELVNQQAAPETVLSAYVRKLHSLRTIAAGNARTHPERFLAAMTAIVDEAASGKLGYTFVPGSAETKWVFPLRGSLFTLRGSFDALAQLSDNTVAVCEFKYTTNSFFIDRYASSLQLLFYALALREVFGMATPTVILDVTCITTEALRVFEGVYKTGPNKGKPKPKRIGDVPVVDRRIYTLTFTKEQLAEAECSIRYWLQRADASAFQRLFLSRYGDGCPFNPSGMSRFDSVANQSVFRLIHAQPTVELRHAATDMYLSEPDDGYCAPWPINTGLTDYLTSSKFTRHYPSPKKAVPSRGTSSRSKTA